MYLCHPLEKNLFYEEKSQKSLTRVCYANANDKSQTFFQPEKLISRRVEFLLTQTKDDIYSFIILFQLEKVESIIYLES